MAPGAAATQTAPVRAGGPPPGRRPRTGARRGGPRPGPAPRRGRGRRRRGERGPYPGSPPRRRTRSACCTRTSATRSRRRATSSSRSGSGGRRPPHDRQRRRHRPRLPDAQVRHGPRGGLCAVAEVPVPRRRHGDLPGPPAEVRRLVAPEGQAEARGGRPRRGAARGPGGDGPPLRPRRPARHRQLLRQRPPQAGHLLGGRGDGRCLRGERRGGPHPLAPRPRPATG